jgi:tubulin delta
VEQVQENFISSIKLIFYLGSGLGAYVVECIRDELPRSFLLTTIVVPYSSGEVVVQNYNSLLTLSHLYHSTDALLVFENDTLQQYAKKLVSFSGLDRPTNIHDMNDILTRHLCSFLQPISNQSKTICEINSLLESVLPHSFYKLLTLRCVPQLSDQALDFSTYKWSSLIKTLSQMYINNSYLDEGLNWSLKPFQTRTKSVGNIFLARSYDTENIENDLKQYFNHQSFYSSFNSPNDSYYLYNYRDKSYLNYEKYLSFISNCQTPITAFDRIVSKSWQLFGQKAYLHHYFKYDIEEQAFLNGFVQIEQVIKSYNQL